MGACEDGEAENEKGRREQMSFLKRRAKEEVVSDRGGGSRRRLCLLSRFEVLIFPLRPKSLTLLLIPYILCDVFPPMFSSSRVLR